MSSAGFRAGRIQVLSVLVISLLFTIFLFPTVARATDRVDTVINSDWKFHKGDVADAHQSGYDDSLWDTVDVPHTWNALDGEDGGNDYYRGVGWYRKHHLISNTYLGQRVFLFFEAVGKTADVYVNGAYVGRHEGSYAAFCFEITDQVDFGLDNVIAVKADNSSSLEIAPLSGDFTQWGGICRSVRLLITNPVHITPLDYASPGVYLTTTNVSGTSSDLEVKTKVRNDNVTAKDVTVRAVIKNADNVLVDTLTTTLNVGGQNNRDFIQNTTVANPHLWDGLDDPYLYKVVVEVESDSSVVDVVEQPLGFRYFSVDPDLGFFLNGQYYDLRGVAHHEDREDKGRAISDADREEDINLILEMGCTFIRPSHYQHAETIYDLADQNGIVVWTEIPLVNEIKDTIPFADNAKQQLKELIRQNHNHPSICFWGLFNEITLGGGPDPTALITELNTLAHTEDNSRLTTAASCCGDYHATTYISDVLAYNKYFGWYGSSAYNFAGWADGIHANRPADEIGVSEYGAGASIYHHEENPSPPAPGGPWHPEEYQAFFHEVHWQAMKDRPYLWCKTIWNGFDFGADHRNEGDRAGINDKGMVIRDRTIKKDAFFWYKCNWSNTPTVHITSRRFTPRYQNADYVKVYSNCDEVELFINGISQGTLTSSSPIYQWNDVKLRPGPNEIKAIGRIGISEYIDICTWDFIFSKKLTVAVVTASSYQDEPGEYHPPEHTIDGDMETRWAALGIGEWIKYDLGSMEEIDKIKIAFYRGDQRRAYFDIHVSSDDVTWIPILIGGVSSGTTTQLEEFDFTDTAARYLRITANGNSLNEWNSYFEVEIHGVILCSDVIAAGLALDADFTGPEGQPDCYINMNDYTALSADWLIPPVENIYEAEDAELHGPTIANNHTGYTGTGFVDFPDADTTGDYIKWIVYVPDPDSYTLEFRYSNGGTFDRPLEIKVNDAVVHASFSFPPIAIGSWDAWDTVSIDAALNAGNNTVQATTIGTRGPNIDHLHLPDIQSQSGYSIEDLFTLCRTWLDCVDPQDPACDFWP